MDRFINYNENEIDHVDTAVCVSLMCSVLHCGKLSLLPQTPSIPSLEAIHLYDTSTNPDICSDPSLLIFQCTADPVCLQSALTGG